LLQRCSRPLCRSQTTSPPTTNPTHTVRLGRGRHQATKHDHNLVAGLIPQGPTVCQRPPHPSSTPGSTPTPLKKGTG
jgi:hypothetical protein